MKFTTNLGGGWVVDAGLYEINANIKLKLEMSLAICTLCAWLRNAHVWVGTSRAHIYSIPNCYATSNNFIIVQDIFKGDCVENKEFCIYFKLLF